MEAVLKELRTIKSKSLSAVIYRQLEEMILAGEIKPGERINESQLSAALQVSRAPIREACRQLEKHGMVEVLANRGTFVRSIRPEEVVELYDIRAALEALAGERAAHRIGPEERRALKAQMDKMKKAARDGAVVGYFEANAEFHSEIIRASGNKSLAGLYDSICKQVSLFRKTSLSLPGRLALSFQQHQEILAALLSGDGRAAGARLRHHVLDAGGALVAALTGSKTAEGK